MTKKEYWVNYYGDKDFVRNDFTYDNEFQLKRSKIMCIIGKTGSGKTSLVPTLLKLHVKPDKICIFSGSDPSKEFIYEKLKMKGRCPDTNEMLVQCHHGFSNFFEVMKKYEEEDDGITHLALIIDDFMGESDKFMDKIAYYCTYSRKGLKKGITVIMLAQSFFRLPIMARQQMHYAHFMGGMTGKNMKAIVQNHNADITPEQHMILYKRATKMPENTIDTEKYKYFYLLDFETDNPNLMTRSGWYSPNILDETVKFKIPDLL